MTTDQTPPAVWIDGDPLMEAIAAAVWERCERSDSGLVIDDPRNIAAAAAAVVSSVGQAPATDRTAELTAAIYDALVDFQRTAQLASLQHAQIRQHLAEHLAGALALRMGIEPTPETVRAATLREAADIAESLRQFEPAYGARKSAQVSENVGILRVADKLRRLAVEAAVPGRTTDETAAVDRGAVLLEIATTLDQLAETDMIRKRRSLGTARRLLAGELRRMADDAPAVGGAQQPKETPRG
jgi:hypothetical protein